jgi:hypothetical protein
MATCRTTDHGHREGWGPVSTLREFDLTPCFEEGIILSTLLVVLLVVSLFRLWGIKSRPVDHTLTARSTSVLTAKLVRSVVMLGSLLSTDDTLSANPDECRSSSEPPSPSAWQTSHILSLVMSAFRSSNPTSSNRSPYSPQSSSPTPTTSEAGHPPQPCCSSGLPTSRPSLFGDVHSSRPILRTSAMSSFFSPSDLPLRCSDSFPSLLNCLRPNSNQTSTRRSTRHK